MPRPSPQLERTDPVVLTALVSTGAAVTLTAGGVARADITLEGGAKGIVFVAIVGLVAVGGMTTFIAGVRHLGPSRASIVSAVQPALTPLVGFAVLADRLGIAQMLGGALVVLGVVVLEFRPGPIRRPPRRFHGPNDVRCLGLPPS